MRGSTFVTIGLAVIGGVIIADFLIHPQGTIAAGNAANNLLVPSYAALLGVSPGYSQVKG